ncbi:MAG TPA: hypothetical protein VNY52_06965 [Solirubrobacteraceae bacterium]|jgi:uncharacterized repeat protein (TIGR01451 family)|nr:hypothetical protein [Solirubrobacteraceae bacterium]
MSALESSIRGIAGTCVARVRPVCLPPLSALALVLIAVFAPGSALAVTQRPQWTVTAVSNPTYLPPEGSGEYIVEVRNTGDAPTDGSEIVVTDALPSGLTAASSAAGEYIEGAEGSPETSVAMSCTGLKCGYSGVVVPDGAMVVKVHMEVAKGAPSSVTNVVSVTGGGALEAIRETPTTISSASAPFGIAAGSTGTALSSAQAGAHPDLTSSLALTTDSSGLLSGAPRETGLDLPPGFVIDIADAPKCSISDFSKQEQAYNQTCAPGTQIGTVTLVINPGGIFGFTVGELLRVVEPVYNLTTNPGEIARFGFYTGEFGVEGTTTVRPGDYGGRTTFHNIRTNLLEGVSLTVWGVPSEASHDAMRGLACEDFFGGRCERSDGETGFIKNEPSTSPPVPYFTDMTQCTGAPAAGTFFAASWQEPERQVTAPTSFGPVTGCDLLEFGPYITAAPDTSRADTPAGFTFDVKMPQEGLVNAEGLSSADIENTTATLPAGVVINPGQAAGLAACPFSQDGIGVEGPPSCPSNSKVGEVEVETPLLPRTLKGPVYVLASNPPEVKLLVAPEDPTDGLYVKFVGTVHLSPTTGQLVTTFEQTPKLPFNNLRLSFSGGAQAALATPTGCGTYTTTGLFAPWSGEREALTASSFAIESGPGGSGCASPLPFSPELIAGATTDQAGGFTHFSLLLQRADGQQRIASLQFKVPEGLLGMISKVPLCGEPQASKGECPADSQIGHTVVEAGPGPYPLVVPQPGQPPAPIYLTGGYRGAPYGLSIVVPLVVGPFTLQTQVVRGKIEVDPFTAQLTVTTDPFPTIIDGVPADLRSINAVIDRPGFMFNPTSCAPMSFAGTAFSTEGASAGIASHFQVGSCQSLKFQPDFKVSTQGKTSRLDGASLDARIVYPSGALPDNQASSQSNIKLVKVELPKQLPSRLSTLQKACPGPTFDANPAACPAASRIGEASASTPVLPVGLSGPVYFVSRGGAKFPELVIVLSGYGTTVQLHGETFISKAGITSSTFRSVPDVPITSFELKLPEGPFSALAANGNLCRSSLVMPTEFIAQNGAELHQSTKITVTGCPKAKKVAHKRKRARGRKASRPAPGAGGGSKR